MTVFETIGEALHGRGLNTGLPQLDRVAPLGPGHLAVLIGASGVGKSRVVAHIVDTVSCIHEGGTLCITAPLSLDELDAALVTAAPDLCVVDPVSLLATPPGAVPDELMPQPRQSVEHLSPDDRPLGGPALQGGASTSDTVADLVERHEVHPAELGRVATRLRELAVRRGLPVLACHRYAPNRDSVTGQIVSTESAVNPLLDVADVVIVVRVQADPEVLGLEVSRNRLGPTGMLYVPLATPQV